MATFPIYQLYAELTEYEPKMYRRFQVMNDITLARLAYILMVIFEIRTKHSYEFRKDELEVYKKKHPEYERNPERLKQLNRTFKKLRYGITTKKNMYMYKKSEGYEELADATNIRLRDILVLENEEITFYYDPEVNWKINIKLEKIFTDKKMFSKDLPKILEGQGFGIIEQCASVKKLEEFCRSITDKKELEKYKINYYKETKKSRKIDLNDFDIEDMNYRVKILPRSLQEYYEQGEYLSDRKFKIARRDYKVYRKKQ